MKPFTIPTRDDLAPVLTREDQLDMFSRALKLVDDIEFYPHVRYQVSALKVPIYRMELDGLHTEIQAAISAEKARRAKIAELQEAIQ